MVSNRNNISCYTEHSSYRILHRVKLYGAVLRVLLCVSVLAASGAGSVRASVRHSSVNKELLERLDKLVDDRESYYDKRRAKADSVRRLIDCTGNVGERLRLYLNYGDIWSGMSSDSAIAICNCGLQKSIAAADSFYAQQFTITRAHGLFNRGLIHECLTDIKNVETQGLRSGVEERYHYICHVVYLTIGAFYKGELPEYVNYGRDHVMSELSFIDPESPNYKYCEALTYMVDGKMPQMASNLHSVVADTEHIDEINPLAYTLLGEYYVEQEDYEQAVFHYATGAMADILEANLDGVALLVLGELLYRMGDTSRAYNYMAAALESAVQGNMKFNLMRMNQAFMDVSRDVANEKYQKMALLSGLVVILFILLALVAKNIVDKRTEVERLVAIENSLAKANMVKETYIAEFMNLCSNYIESLEDYNKMSRRKITAGKIDELLDYIKSGRIIEEQRHKFYEVFDEALLHIYPSYVQEVNRLLQPDKQIVPPLPNSLTTELRILALSRLGIDDVSIIARFLGISANTIYTYRNRLRTRAVNRFTFEEDAKKIGTV